MDFFVLRSLYRGMNIKPSSYSKQEVKYRIQELIYIISDGKSEYVKSNNPFVYEVVNEYRSDPNSHNTVLLDELKNKYIYIKMEYYTWLCKNGHQMNYSQLGAVERSVNHFCGSLRSMSDRLFSIISKSRAENVRNTFLESSYYSSMRSARKIDHEVILNSYSDFLEELTIASMQQFSPFISSEVTLPKSDFIQDERSEKVESALLSLSIMNKGGVTSSEICELISDVDLLDVRRLLSLAEWAILIKGKYWHEGMLKIQRKNNEALQNNISYESSQNIPLDEKRNYTKPFETREIPSLDVTEQRNRVSRQLTVPAATKKDLTLNELIESLNAFLKESSDGISKEDILAHFGSFSTQQINRALTECHAVKVLKKYYHRDNISDFNEMADILLDILLKQFAANGDYTSAQQLYNDAHFRLDDFFFYCQI